MADEDSSGGITACTLTDGRAIVMWPNSARVRYAIVDGGMGSVRRTGSVTAAMTQTALGPVYELLRCAVFRVGDDLFFSALGSTSPTERHWQRVYKANSASNPTSWSLHAEIHAGINMTIGGVIDFGGNITTGTPTILPSGRWVFTGAHVYYNPSLTGWYGRHGGIWTSDNGGVSWTKRAELSEGGIGSRVNRFSPQIVQNPSNGNLYVMYEVASGARTMVSTNDGTSWSNLGVTPPGHATQLYLDNGTTMYAVNPNSTTADIYTFSGSAYSYTGSSIWDPEIQSGQSFTTVANSFYGPFGNGGDNTRFIVDSGKVWYFVDQYMARPRRSWWAGEVGFIG